MDDNAPGKKSHEEPASALEQAAEIADRLDGKELALFLDYDGTLTPIVRRAEDAILSEAMRSLLSALAEHCTVAIVSGRDRGDAQGMVQLDHLVYAGINAAIAYNIWRYFEATGDVEFLSFYGVEMLLEIARFWTEPVFSRH